MRHETACPGFFDRAVGVHREDCAALQLDPAFAAEIDEADRNDVAALENLAGSEASLAYGIAVRQAYDLMRRLIGQLSGLLILSIAGGRHNILGLPDIERAHERIGEVRALLGELTVPSPLARHHAALQLALANICDATEAIGRINGRSECEATAAATTKLDQAYRLLQAAADPRVGMTMVDFRHACCTCGQRHTNLDQ
jgi:hypothetical protein